MKSPSLTRGFYYPVAGMDEVRHNKRVRDVVAVLHNIRSIHNIGSMFRTADGAGVRKLYLCGITPTPLDRFGNLRHDFQKVALGAERNMPWEYVSTAARAIRSLKAEGFIILSLEQDPKSTELFRYRTRAQKLALVVGNEVRGLTPSLLAQSDAILEIPMRGEKESLNVSVAFGIVAYSLLS